MDGLVLGASSGIAQALLLEAWAADPGGRGRWVLTTRTGQALPGLAAAAGPGRELLWRAAEARQDPRPWLEALPEGWRPERVLVAWGRLVPGGQGSAAELQEMREINGAGTLRWLEALADWLDAAGRASHVAVLGSVAGDRPRRSMWDYSLSKQELERGLERLRPRATRLRWTLVKPGPVATPMTAHLPDSPLLATPAGIAPRVLRAWEQGRPQVYAPAWWGWISRALNLLPEFLWQRVRF
ncbi:MAG: hypothetical protein WC326_00500 [Candidatus Delongbacteria bacterium]